MIPRWTVKSDRGRVYRIVAASAVQAALSAAYRAGRSGEFLVKSMSGFGYCPVAVVKYGEGLGVESRTPIEADAEYNVVQESWTRWGHLKVRRI